MLLIPDISDKETQFVPEFLGTVIVWDLALKLWSFYCYFKIGCLFQKQFRLIEELQRWSMLAVYPVGFPGTNIFIFYIIMICLAK